MSMALNAFGRSEWQCSQITHEPWRLYNSNIFASVDLWAIGSIASLEDLASGARVFIPVAKLSPVTPDHKRHSRDNKFMARDQSHAS